MCRCFSRHKKSIWYSKSRDTIKQTRFFFFQIFTMITISNAVISCLRANGPQTLRQITEVIRPQFTTLRRVSLQAAEQRVLVYLNNLIAAGIVLRTGNVYFLTNAFMQSLDYTKSHNFLYPLSFLKQTLLYKFMKLVWINISEKITRQIQDKKVNRIKEE